MAVESPATSVDKPTPTEEPKIGGSGPPTLLSRLAIRNTVMMDTVALKRTWIPRAIKTGNDGETRFVAGQLPVT